MLFWDITHPTATRYHPVKTTFTILFVEEEGNKQDSGSPGKNNEIQIDF